MSRFLGARLVRTAAAQAYDLNEKGVDGTIHVRAQTRMVH